MKQLGNLAVICAQRPELLMQLRGGLVLVFMLKSMATIIIMDIIFLFMTIHLTFSLN